MTCPHKNFTARVSVHAHEGLWVANISIKCADCGCYFIFEGLEPGAGVDISGRELQAPIRPGGQARESKKERVQ